MKMQSVTDEYIDSWIDIILNLKYKPYKIARIAYNWLMTIRELQRENAELKREIKELLEMKNKKEVYVVEHDNFIANGNPGNFWRTVHEMGA